MLETLYISENFEYIRDRYPTNSERVVDSVYFQRIFNESKSTKTDRNWLPVREALACTSHSWMKPQSFRLFWKITVWPYNTGLLIWFYWTFGVLMAFHPLWWYLTVMVHNDDIINILISLYLNIWALLYAYVSINHMLWTIWITKMVSQRLLVSLCIELAC